MLSYKQWKLVNESVLPSFNLGLGRASNLGIQSQFGLDEAKADKKKKKKMVDDELVKPGKKADKPGEDDEEPEVDVDVDGDNEDNDDEDGHDKEECGAYCAKCMKSKKKCSMCAMKSKKKMASDEDHEEEDEEEGHDEDHEEEDEEEGHDEDHEEEGHDEDHEEEGHDEEAETPKMSKKMMLKGGQHKLDVNKDGKIDGEDFKLMKMMKGKKKHKKGSKKKNESQTWWNSVNSMLSSDPNQRYSDGCEGLFTPIDTDNLYVGVRDE